MQLSMLDVFCFSSSFYFPGFYLSFSCVHSILLCCFLRCLESNFTFFFSVQYTKHRHEEEYSGQVIEHFNLYIRMPLNCFLLLYRNPNQAKNNAKYPSVPLVLDFVLISEFVLFPLYSLSTNSCYMLLLLPVHKLPSELMISKL